LIYLIVSVDLVDIYGLVLNYYRFVRSAVRSSTSWQK